MIPKMLHQPISLPLISKIQRRGVNTPFVLCTPSLVERRIAHLVKQALTELRKQGIPSNFHHVHPIKTNYHREIIESAVKAGSWVEVGSELELLFLKKAIASSKNPLSLGDDFTIFCNGLKTPDYLDLIDELWRREVSVIPIVDNTFDAHKLLSSLSRDIPLGVRLRTLGSRFGLPYPVLLDLIRSGDLQPARLKLIQIHVASQHALMRGQDKIISTITDLAKEISLEHVEWFDVGGGIPQGLTEHQDIRCLHEYLVQLSEFLHELQEQEVVFPTIVSEAGRWVVSAAENLIFQVVGKEREPGEEYSYYHVDGSFITDLVDSFLLDQQWQVVALTSREGASLGLQREKAYLAGNTLDEKDIYPNPETKEPLFLPPFNNVPYYVVFRNVGAYQENLRGLHNFHVPRPRVILVGEEDKEDEFIVRQTAFVEDILARFGW